MSEPLDIVFFGTGEIGEPALRALVASDIARVALVVTGTDKPVGRRQTLAPTLIKAAADELKLPVAQPKRLHDDTFLDRLRGARADLFVVMAFGKILPREILAMPPRGCLNLHASLLPKYRGASPVHAAILNGDAESGITVMHMTETLDAGDVILHETVAIERDETGQSLHDKLAAAAPAALERALRETAAGTAARTPQDESAATWAPKLSRDDGEIRWSEPAAVIERMVRAFHPWPGTFSCLRAGTDTPRLRIKIFPPCAVEDAAAAMPADPGQILEAAPRGIVVATGTGALRVTALQPDGRRQMTAAEFLAGRGGALAGHFEKCTPARKSGPRR